MWISFTKYPMKPMTAKPTATALQIWANSGIDGLSFYHVLQKKGNQPFCEGFVQRVRNWGYGELEQGNRGRDNAGRHTWFPSRMNCWGTSMNSRILSDMIVRWMRELCWRVSVIWIPTLLNTLQKAWTGAFSMSAFSRTWTVCYSPLKFTSMLTRK